MSSISNKLNPWFSFVFIFFLSYRSSRPNVFCKNGVLENFTKFTWRHLCQSLFFNKVAGLSPATLLKKRLWHRCFPVNFVKFLRTPFFTEHLWWLLLIIVPGGFLFTYFIWISWNQIKCNQGWCNEIYIKTVFHEIV